jgi:D-alanyl-D-alanine endopeptidase (penicillin-binding protein 7)
MNRKAAALGMHDTHFGDPTGLDKTNVSTANDLVRLVQADWHNPTIRAFSTSGSLDVTVGRQVLRFNNTNPLLRSEHAGWKIDLSKTGFIQEAGHCLVMRATVAERDVVIVLLNSQGKLTRIGDANRIRRWIEAQPDHVGQRLG